MVWSLRLVVEEDVPHLLIGFTCHVGGGRGCREGWVAFVAVHTQDHGAIVIDVAGVMGGRVTEFIDMVGGGVVL